MYQEQMSQGLSIQGSTNPQSQGTGTFQAVKVDMRKMKRAMFIIDVGSVGSGGTVDAKLQVSPDGTTWTDAASAVPALTTVAITQITANNKQATLEIRADQMAPMTTPAAPIYAGVLVTIGTAAVLCSVISLGGECDQKPANQYDVGSPQRQVASGPS